MFKIAYFRTFSNQLRSKIRHTDYHYSLTDFALAPGSDLVMCLAHHSEAMCSDRNLRLKHNEIKLLDLIASVYQKKKCK